MTKLRITPHERTLIQSGTPLVWLNRSYQNHASAPETPSQKALYEAEARLARFAPLLQILFPELKTSNGLIESPLLEADKLNDHINPLGGKLFLKADHDLPVAGSIKARGNYSAFL